MADRWRNWIEEIEVRGKQARPHSLTDLITLVEDAVRDGAQIRAVGSGHSTTLVAKPVDGQRWIRCEELDNVLDWGLEAAPSNDLVRVEAGITIAALNQVLDAKGLAMPVLGSYDGQTVAGVLSTGTHGSGLKHPPICDDVVAVELVVIESVNGKPTVCVARIEPKDGITSKAKFDAAKATKPSLARHFLIQDDAVFSGAVVGLGALGVLYAVTLKARPRYSLTETRLAMPWHQLKPRLLNEATADKYAEYYDVVLFPHALFEDQFVKDDTGAQKKIWSKGDIPCTVTMRKAGPPLAVPPPSRREPKPFADEVADFFGTGILEHVAIRMRRYHRKLIAKELYKRAQPPYAQQTSASYVIMKTSLGPHVKATSAELWLPLDEVVNAIDRIIALAAANEIVPPHDDIFRNMDESKEWLHTSPIGIRFVKKSRHFMAPSGDQDRATIEVPLLVSTRTVLERERQEHRAYRRKMLRTIEAELIALGGRPHWGQTHFFEAASFQTLYGAAATSYRALRDRFDVTRTFANELTDKLLP